MRNENENDTTEEEQEQEKSLRRGNDAFSFCLNLSDRIRPWLRDYDRLQSFAVILIYLQIGCAIIGSLGASYNGVSLVNLAIALFALVAIESSSQSLGRTYAFLLFCAILLDIAWFILFAHEIWNISTKDYSTFFTFSVKLTLSMQIVGFTVRLSSSLLWIQIYRLGASYMDTTSRAADSDLRSSFMSPVTPAVVRQCSNSNEILGGSIYDPLYYSSLFEDGQENRCSSEMQNHEITHNESTSCAEVSLKSSIGRSFQAADEENGLIKREEQYLNMSEIELRKPCWLVSIGFRVTNKSANGQAV
ncbi:hypothetical protein VNO78_11974 [Psophocarpus tetragonolobus]|uniref:Transmembrane protein n=1 Tax=Psophocarpus tetragonolobus TaxID=3891 RepID=A0AAN9SQ55_PSOTE